jgi:hypothetical protein
MSKCHLRAGYCHEHGFVHGAEAEELRSGIEKLLKADPANWPMALQDLLDRVDARDSLAYLEATDGDEEADDEPAPAFAVIQST